mmetsp:Transcript_18945/g.45384  ORF Transcript_18945/g.45384 Transcript_18945/m.45384 type:complete len:168 (+) Transcript_18945:2-505(+)
MAEVRDWTKPGAWREWTELPGMTAEDKREAIRALMQDTSIPVDERMQHVRQISLSGAAAASARVAQRLPRQEISVDQGHTVEVLGGVRVTLVSKKPAGKSDDEVELELCRTSDGSCDTVTLLCDDYREEALGYWFAATSGGPERILLTVQGDGVTNVTRDQLTKRAL